MSEKRDRSSQGTDTRLIGRINTLKSVGCTHINTGRWGIEFVLWQWRGGRARGSWRGTLVQDDAASRQTVLPQVSAARAKGRGGGGQFISSSKEHYVFRTG